LNAPDIHDNVLLRTQFPGARPFASGKVRDLYEANGALLFVATDRLSAFDYVLPTGIPDKGRVLTQLSLFWFEFLGGAVASHLITAEVSRYPAEFQPFAEQLRGRSMLVRRARMLPIECVVRGYLAGSGWKDYRESGMVCGIPLPAGLKESERLPEPMFTPATKAETGHDINISFEEAARLIGPDLAARLRELSVAIYAKAARYAEQRGIIIADTKFEFGYVANEVVLADEVLTPDSSRFWPADQYRPGSSPPSFDKQYVRDYLMEIGWNKQPPAPPLPPEVAGRTADKYREALRRLAGRELSH
jgi:phosphoribosylaminoimidazole-succinocarboxamide synthase